MKRFRVLKHFIDCLSDNDVAVFSGPEFSREAFENDRDGNFYVLDSPGLAASLALGMAMNSNKRVFLFVGDGEFLMEFGSYAQIAVSKCKNIICVILDNDCYQSAGGSPTIFRSLNSVAGVIFNMGLISLNYTPHFEGRFDLSNMKKKVGNLIGPVAILINIEKGDNKNVGNVALSKKELSERLKKFIENESLGSSMFVPPYSLDFFDVNTDGGNV